MIYRFVLIAFVALAGFVAAPEQFVAVAQQPTVIEARVSKVLDGDSFTIKGQSRRVRVWGLDAPEWDHAGGSTATATLKTLISGRTLNCQVLDLDRYGRFVAQCFLPDGRDIAAEMIRAGVATEYCRYSGGFYGTC
jgi:micrococcal nuclease